MILNISNLLFKNWFKVTHYLINGNLRESLTNYNSRYKYLFNIFFDILTSLITTQNTLSRVVSSNPISPCKTSRKRSIFNNRTKLSRNIPINCVKPSSKSESIGNCSNKESISSSALCFSSSNSISNSHKSERHQLSGIIWWTIQKENISRLNSKYWLFEKTQKNS